MLPCVLLGVGLARQRRVQLATPATAVAFSATSTSFANSAFPATFASFTSFALHRHGQWCKEQDDDGLRIF
mgnify:CR=1 FL=1